MKLLLLLLVLCITGSPAHAGVALFFSRDDVSQVTPGSDFTVNVALVTDQPCIGLDYALAGPWRVTARDFNMSPFSDPLRIDADLTPGSDLGATLADVSHPLPAGSYPVARLTLEVNPGTAAGTYNLTLLGYQGWSDAQFNDHAFAAVPSIPISVSALAPEPHAGWLCLIAAIAASHLTRRSIRR